MSSKSTNSGADPQIVLDVYSKGRTYPDVPLPCGAQPEGRAPHLGGVGRPQAAGLPRTDAGGHQKRELGHGDYVFIGKKLLRVEMNVN